MNKQKLDLACSSAVQQFLTEKITSNKDKRYYKIDSIEVLIDKKQKGILWEVICTAAKTKDTVQVKYLLASGLSLPFDNALIISRPNFRGAVTGNQQLDFLNNYINN